MVNRIYIAEIAALAEMWLYLDALKRDCHQGIILMTGEVNETLNYFWNEFSFAIAIRRGKPVPIHMKHLVTSRIEVLQDDLIYSL